MAADIGLIAFPSRAAMADRIADLVEAATARAVATRGGAALALSGGSTPAMLYGRMARFAAALWRKTDVTLVDERWTPPGAEGSNESFVREALGAAAMAEARFLGLWSDAPSPAEAASRATGRLDALGAPIDIAILGMGADGHTASWFPYAEGLDAALSGEEARVVAVRAARGGAAGAHPDRLTLTLAAVAEAKLVCLLIFGDEKRAVFEAAMEPGPVEAMPVRAILRRRPDLWACWAP